MSSSAESIGLVHGGRQPDRTPGAEPEGAAAAQPAAALSGTVPAVPARAGGLELLGEFAGSGYRRAPALVRRADGQTVQLTPLLFHLLEAIDGTRDYAELAAVVGQRTGKLATPDQIRFLAETKLRPLGLLRRPDGTDPEAQKPNPLLALRLKYVVSNPNVTRRIAAPFTPLFHPSVVTAFVLAFALTIGWIVFEKGLASAARQALYEPAFLLIVFALTVLSASFHEIGHAAACRYGGGRPGAMGVGLYLVWPAFYTDVSDSYRLSRADRLRVDLGGLYFNAIFAVGILALWATLDSDALLLVIAAQLLQMVRQLVPIVRFDGYHALADLTGVPDLFWHIKPTLLGLLPTRWGKGKENPLKPWARAVVTLWVAVVVPLLLALLVLLVVMLPRIAATAWDSIGLHWAAVQANWAASSASAVAAGLLSILLVSLPVLGISYLLVRVVRRLVRSVWRATEGRSTLRAGAVLAGAIVVAAVGWAWWPDGQYRPLDAGDRWAVPGLMAPTPKLQPAAATGTPAPVGPSAAAGVPSGSAPSSARAGGRLALVLLPGPVPAAGQVVTRPIVLPPVPPAEANGGAPAVAPAEPPPAPPEPLPAPGTDGDPLEPPAAETAESSPAAAAEPPPAEPADPAPAEWVFPFRPPREPRDGDNQVVAVNTQDGSTVYNTALALVWVTEGAPVEQRNEAWALASCSGCRTVAVAFQVVLVVGYSNHVAPINAAVAVNYECDTCLTNALAVQLVATLTRQPSAQTMSALNDLWARIELVSESFDELPLETVYAQLLVARALVLQVLAQDVGTTDTGTGVADGTGGSAEADDADAPPDDVTTVPGEPGTTSPPPSAPPPAEAGAVTTTPSLSGDGAPPTDPDAGATTADDAPADETTTAETTPDEPVPGETPPGEDADGEGADAGGEDGEGEGGDETAGEGTAGDGPGGAGQPPTETTP